MTDKQIVSNVIERLTAWSRNELAAIGVSGAYVFGSLIYRKGEQFGERSDIDLVVVVPTEVDGALKRVQWLQSLFEQKRRLETDLAAILGRNSSTSPICSTVAVTNTEIELNVHKDGAVGFFTENQFYDLIAAAERKGLPSAGTKETVDRLVGECLRFAQKKRNLFFGSPFLARTHPAPVSGPARMTRRASGRYTASPPPRTPERDRTFSSATYRHGEDCPLGQVRHRVWRTRKRA